MKGRVMSGEKILSNAVLNVFTDSTTSFKNYTTDSLGFCTLELPLQKFFTIKITKPGYVAKIMTADTYVPIKDKLDYSSEFTADLFEEISGIDVSILKSPIAKVFFDTLTNVFDYDSIYTARINASVQKLYNDFYLKKSKIDSIRQNPDAKADTASEVKSASDTVMMHKPIISQQKIIFSIQIFASTKQRQKNSALFSGLANVKEIYENGIYKYYTGEYPDYNEAKKMREIIKSAFPGAFIISFNERRKISVKEAMGF